MGKPLSPELIETLWNVNNVKLDYSNIFNVELIETLWNVNNYVQQNDRNLLFGINRNIVECKCKCFCSRSYKLNELIETLWNVNDVTLGA